MREKEDCKATEHIIKGSVGKRQVFGIHLEHRGMGKVATLDFCRCLLNHAGSQINAYHPTMRSDNFCCGKEVGTSASRNIQYLGTLWYCEMLYEMLPCIGKVIWANLTIR